MKNHVSTEWTIAAFAVLFLFWGSCALIAFSRPLRPQMGNYESAISCQHRFCGIWIHGKVRVIRARDGVKVFWQK